MSNQNSELEDTKILHRAGGNWIISPNYLLKIFISTALRAALAAMRRKD